MDKVQVQMIRIQTFKMKIFPLPRWPWGEVHIPGVSVVTLMGVNYGFVLSELELKYSMFGNSCIYFASHTRRWETVGAEWWPHLDSSTRGGIDRALMEAEKLLDEADVIIGLDYDRH